MLFPEDYVLYYTTVQYNIFHLSNNLYLHTRLRLYTRHHLLTGWIDWFPSSTKGTVSYDFCRVGNSLFGFCVNWSFFWERKRESVIHSFQSDLVALFAKSNCCECHLLQRATRAFCSFVLGIQRGKSLWKEQIWSELLLKRANRSRHSLLKDNILSLCSLQKEWRERIAPVAL